MISAVSAFEFEFNCALFNSSEGVKATSLLVGVAWSFLANAEELLSEVSSLEDSVFFSEASSVGFLNPSVATWLDFPEFGFEEIDLPLASFLLGAISLSESFLA